MYDPTIWEESNKQRLLQAILLIQNKEQGKAVVGDLLTDSEIDEISRRLSIARYLDKGKSYQFINKKTGASTTTIASVSKQIQEGSGGYRLILNALETLPDDQYTAATQN